MFDVLYYDITKKKTKKNSAFFKIIRDLIMISSNNTSDKLFNKNGDNPSFWQNCLNIIK